MDAATNRERPGDAALSSRRRFVSGRSAGRNSLDQNRSGKIQNQFFSQS
jgi:hypothetical protein